MLRFKNISRQVFILGLISFFTDFASEMLYPIVPLFLTVTLGASMAVVGIIEGIAAVTSGMLKGYFGLLSDKIGKRSIFVRWGYGLSAIVKSLPGIFPSISSVIFYRTVDRVGKGIRTAPRDALLSVEAKQNSGAVFGFHRGMDTLGAVVGPLIALLILYFLPGNYRIIFLVAIIPSLSAIYFTFKVKDPADIKKSIYEKHYKAFWKQAPAAYKKLMIIITIFSLANSSDVFLILKSKAVSGSDSTAILGYVFYNFIYAALSYPVGILSDKFGKKNIFTFGIFIFAIVYFGFASDPGFLIIWGLFALYGLYSAATEGVSKAWISDLIKPEFKGTAMGLFTLVTSLALMIGSLLAGILWDLYGAQFPFFLSAIVSSTIAFVLIFNRKGLIAIQPSQDTK